MRIQKTSEVLYGKGISENLHLKYEGIFSSIKPVEKSLRYVQCNKNTSARRVLLSQIVQQF